MRIVLALTPVLLFAACGSSIERAEPSSNEEVAVGLLTTWPDGTDVCKLWRVRADGRSIYVARCGADVRAFEEHRSGGKHRTTHTVEAITVEAEAR